MIIGMVFIEKETKQIEMCNHQIVPDGGRAVEIVGSFEDEAAEQSLNDTVTQCNETSKKKPHTLEVAKNETRLLISEALILACTS